MVRRRPDMVGASHKPLPDAISKTQLCRTPECQDSLEELRTRMTDLPRAHCNPDTLIDDDHCLVIMPDASDVRVGSALRLVNRADASKVTLGDLKDRKMSTLVAIDAKVLSAAEQRWFTLEQEICATYRGGKKWGKLLIRATQGYPQGEGNMPKVSIRLDNTTTTKPWTQMQQPQQIEHAGAKEMRILGWTERVAFINELPVHTAYCPGELNSFGDLVS